MWVVDAHALEPVDAVGHDLGDRVVVSDANLRDEVDVASGTVDLRDPSISATACAVSGIE